MLTYLAAIGAAAIVCGSACALVRQHLTMKDEGVVQRLTARFGTL